MQSVAIRSLGCKVESRVYDARMRLKMTSLMLARVARVPHHVVIACEASGHAPPEEHLPRLAKALGVSENFLRYRDDESQREAIEGFKAETQELQKTLVTYHCEQSARAQWLSRELGLSA